PGPSHTRRRGIARSPATAGPGRQRRPARTDDDAVGHAEPSAVFGHQPAYISSAGSSTRCRGLNISSEGAAIDVPNPAYVPNRFRLMAERDCLTRNRRIVWIKQNQIGVMFEMSSY